jgi:phenylpropionate dioxygenase-like ring-hydroxylating dioxygenase large terminal subunit
MASTLDALRPTARDGSAYDMPPPTFQEDLVSVERHTPGGEMQRRYWHPIALVDEVKDLPIAVRVLGEDLVLFRTGDGFGLVHPRCAHRGTSLLYGRVEERGIRCCYHGWLFDAQGRCLEQPCEPGGRSPNCDKIRQPWYPTEARYGLVFAYLGALDRKPPLPRYDVLEDVGPGERLHANGNSIGSGGPPRMPCNWLQTHENVMDTWHVYVLHSTFTENQFNELMSIRPEIEWERTATGVVAISRRNLPDGRKRLRRVVEVVVPNVRIVADPRLAVTGHANNVAWTLPIDRTNTRIFTVFRLPVDAPAMEGAGPMYNGKRWSEMTAEEHQRFPGDFEAQVSQGDITYHSEEHLASSDRGVVMFRRALRQAIDDVASGSDVPGTAVGAQDALHKVLAGNFIEEIAS